MSTPAPPRLRLLHSSATTPSIDLAITGEQQDGRLKETYSNNALMYGALWDFAAAHNGNPDWKRSAARLERGSEPALQASQHVLLSR